MTMTVWVRFTVERHHYWPGAPDDDLHRHLRSEHRHLFHVEVGVSVDDHDREVSFEGLRADARVRFMDRVPLVSTMSCEHMAQVLAAALGEPPREGRRGYDLRYVTVSEDDESGATWRPD